MKYLFNYYAAIFLPLLYLILIDAYGLLSSTEFAIALLFYACIYHPVISGLRLVSLGKIKKSNLFLNFIPGWNLKHFGILFFNLLEDEK